MIKLKPIIEYVFGTWLKRITPTITVEIIVSPAKEAYVIPIGIFFITIDNAYIHATIVIPVMILGKRRVNPSALLAKLFEVTPRITARIRKPYEVARLI